MVITVRIGIFSGLLAILIINSAYAYHDDAARISCLSCHLRLPFSGNTLLFAGSADAVCDGCHRDRHGTNGGYAHPLGVVPSAVLPADMPLDDQGRIFCGTCHIFHERPSQTVEHDRYLLRRSSAKALCAVCHGKR